MASNGAGVFTRAGAWTARASGHPAAFSGAVLILLVWLGSGPLFGWSDTWQLVANTVTNVATLLMVFLVQNSQNRDTAAVQLKLNEIIRSLGGAHNILLNMDELTDEDLQRLQERYADLARRARGRLERGLPDTDAPQIKLD